MSKVDEIATKAAEKVMAPLSMRMDAMERLLREGAASGSSADSAEVRSGTGGAPFSRGRGVASPTQGARGGAWTDSSAPGCCEIKGYVKNWKDPEATALLEPEAHDLVSRLKTKMDELHPQSSALIDWERSIKILERAAFWCKIKIFFKQPDRSTGFRVKKALETAMVGQHINGKEVVVGLELAECKRAAAKGAGKMHSFLEGEGLGKKDYKIEWRTDQDTHEQLLMLRIMADGERPLTVANWKDESGWTILHEQWDRVSFTTKAADAKAKID